MKRIRRINQSDFITALKAGNTVYREKYFAMFSSFLGGIVLDPSLMVVPVDDHLVHRGDGVFESMICVDGGIYGMGPHLKRLGDSAAKLGYRLPFSLDEIKQIIIEVVKAGGQPDCLIRVIISRGPGGLGANPYECIGEQIYVIAYRTIKPFMDNNPEGARVATSSISIKPGIFAKVKSCNYLPNAMMKKEAVDRGVDFVVTFDSKGFLGEGATESMGIVTRKKELLFPKLGSVLAGTTMERVMKLAQHFVKSGALLAARREDITHKDIFSAEEVIIAGTTCRIVAVREFDGVIIGSGKPGDISKNLGTLLNEDMFKNIEMRTQVF